MFDKPFQVFVGKTETSLKPLNVIKFGLLYNDYGPSLYVEGKDKKSTIYDLNSNIFSYRGWGGRSIPLWIDKKEEGEVKVLDTLMVSYIKAHETIAIVHTIDKDALAYDLTKYMLVCSDPDDYKEEG